MRNFSKPKPAPIAKVELYEWFESASAERREALALLIRLCRGETVESLEPQIWTVVATVARSHGLLILLASRLDPLAPPDQIADLHEKTRFFAQRNLLLGAETLRLAAAFSAAGIESAVFKGCLLSQMAHGASHLRQVIDMDFLVRPSDLAASVRVLESCGYYLDESWTTAICDGHFEYDCESCLFNKKHRTCVDLHWNFTPRNCHLPLQIEAFFTELQPVPLHGRNVLTFSPEDQILALCVHGAKHYWQKLEWIYTVATMIRNDPALDLAVVLERAETMGLRHIVASGLILSQFLFDLPLPERIRNVVNANAAAWEMARTAMSWVADAPNGPPTPMQIRSFHALSRPTWRAKLSYWFGVVATPTEKDYSRPLPRVLHPLYFVLRLYRLIGEAIAAPKMAYNRTLGTTPRTSWTS